MSYVSGNSMLKKLPFFLITFFGLIRYDTTTDYSAYVLAFWDIKKNLYDGWFEEGFVLLNKFFSFSQFGFVPLLMFSLIIPYNEIYKILKREKILVLGALVFLTFGYFIRFENIVRQGLSMGIFYYSLQYALDKKYIKYLIAASIAIFIHSSAFVFIPYYFLIRYYAKAKINTYYWGIALLSLFILYMINGTSLILNLIITNIPFLQDLISNEITSQKSLGLTLLFKIIIAWLPSYYLKDHANNQFVNLSINLSVLSVLISLILIDIIILERVVEYLYIFQIVSISVMLKRLMVKRNLYLTPLGCIFLMMVYHYRNVDSYYKDYNYQSIFSENFENNIFYKRKHRWNTKNFDNDDNVNRDTKIKLTY